MGSFKKSQNKKQQQQQSNKMTPFGEIENIAPVQLVIATPKQAVDGCPCKPLQGKGSINPRSHHCLNDRDDDNGGPSSAHAKVSHLIRLNEALVKEIAALRRITDELRASVTGLEEQLLAQKKTSDDEKSRLLSEAASLSEQVSILTQKRAEEEEAMAEKMEEYMGRSAAEKQALKLELQLFAREVEKLQFEREDLAAMNASLVSDLAESKQGNEDMEIELQQKMEAMLIEKQSWEESNASLATSLEESVAAKGEMVKLMESKEKLIEATESYRTESKSRNESLLSDLAHSKQESEDMAMQLGQLQTKLKQRLEIALAEKQSWEERNASLAAALADSDAAKAVLAKQIKAKEKQMKSKDKLIRSKEKLIESKESSLIDSKRRNELLLSDMATLKQQIEAMSVQLGEVQAEKQLLEENNMSLANALSNSIVEKDDMEKWIGEKESALNEQERRIASLAHDLADSKQQNEDMAGQLGQVQAELRQTTEILLSEKQSLEENNASLATALADLIALNSDMEKQIGEKESVIAERERRNTSLESDIRQMQAELSSRAEAFLAEKHSLESALSDSVAEKGNMVKQIEEKESALSVQEWRNSLLESDLLELKLENEQIDVRLGEVQEELRMKVVVFDAEKQSLEERNAFLAFALAGCEAQKGDMEKQIEAKERRNMSLESDLSDMAGKLGQMQTELSNRMDIFLTEKRQLEDSNASLVSDLAGLEAIKVEMEKQIEDKDLRNASLVSDLADMSGKLEKMRTELSDQKEIFLTEKQHLEDNNASLATALVGYEAQKDNLEKLIEEKESALSDQKARNASLESDLADMAEKLAQIQTELSNRMEIFLSEKTSLEENNASLATALEDSEALKDEMVKQMEAKERSNASLESDLSDMAKKLEQTQAELSTQMDDFLLEKTSLEEKNALLATALVDSEALKNDILKQMEEKERRNATLVSDLSDMSAKLVQTQAELSDRLEIFLAEKTSLEGNCASIAAALEDSEALKDDLAKRMAEKESRNAALESDLSNMAKKLEQIQAELSTRTENFLTEKQCLEKSNLLLATSLADSEAQKDEMEKQIEDKQSGLVEMVGKLDRIKAELTHRVETLLAENQVLEANNAAQAAALADFTMERTLMVKQIEENESANASLASDLVYSKQQNEAIAMRLQRLMQQTEALVMEKRSLDEINSNMAKQIGQMEAKKEEQAKRNASLASDLEKTQAILAGKESSFTAEREALEQSYAKSKAKMEETVARQLKQKSILTDEKQSLEVKNKALSCAHAALKKKSEDMAKQQKKAAEKLGQHKATNSLLTEQISCLRTEKKALEASNGSLIGALSDSKLHLEELMKHNADMAEQLVQLQASFAVEKQSLEASNSFLASALASSEERIVVVSEELRETQQKLMSENASLRSEFVDMEEVMKGQVEGMAARNASLEASNASLAASLAASEEQRAVVSEELQKAQHKSVSENASLRSEFAGKEEQLKGQVEELKQQFELNEVEFAQEKESLVLHKQSLEASNASLASALAASEDRLALVSGELRGIQQKLVSENASLRSEFAEMEEQLKGQVEELKQQFELNEAEFAREKKSLALQKQSLESSNASFASALAASEEKIAIVVEESQETKKKLASEFAEMEEQLKGQVEEMAAQNSSLLSSVSEIRQQFELNEAKFARENESLVLEKQLLESGNVSLSSALAGLKEQIGSALEELHEAQQKLATEREMSEAAMVELNGQVESMAVENASLLSSLAELKEQHEQKEGNYIQEKEAIGLEKQGLIARNSEISSALDSAMERIAAVSDQLQVSEAASTELKGQVEAMAAQIAEFKDQFELSEASHNQKEEAVDLEKQALEASSASLSSSLADLMEKFASVSEQLQQTQQSLVTEKQDSEAIILSLRSKVAELEERMKDMSLSVASLETALTGLKAQDEDSMKRIADLAKGNSALSLALADSKEEIGRMEVQMNGLVVEKQLLESVNMSLSSTVADLKKRVEEAMELRTVLESALEESKVEVECRIKQQEQTHAKLNCLTGEKRSLASAFAYAKDQTQATVAEFQKEVEGLKKEKRELETELGERDAHVLFLETELAASRSTLLELQGEEKSLLNGKRKRLEEGSSRAVIASSSGSRVVEIEAEEALKLANACLNVQDDLCLGREHVIRLGRIIDALALSTNLGTEGWKGKEELSYISDKLRRKLELALVRDKSKIDAAFRIEQLGGEGLICHLGKRLSGLEEEKLALGEVTAAVQRQLGELLKNAEEGVEEEVASLKKKKMKKKKKTAATLARKLVLVDKEVSYCPSHHEQKAMSRFSLSLWGKSKLVYLGVPISIFSVATLFAVGLAFSWKSA